MAALLPFAMDMLEKLALPPVATVPAMEELDADIDPCTRTLRLELMEIGEAIAANVASRAKQISEAVRVIQLKAKVNLLSCQEPHPSGLTRYFSTGNSKLGRSGLRRVVVPGFGIYRKPST